MTRRSLAGRVALVQTGLTLLALAAVIVGTSFAVTALLQRNRDLTLRETTRRAVGLVTHSGSYALDAEWIERELSEIRSADIRVDLIDPTGFVLASSGPGSATTKPALGCHEDGPSRVCAAKAGIFTVVASVDRSPDIEAHKRLLVALLGVAAVAAVLVSLVSRGVARRALEPLTDLTRRIAGIEPGAGTRIAKTSDFAELELLRARFDELVGRFDEALVRERRLTAQASHELRTPLGVARAEIEALADGENLTQGRARALLAMDRLSQLVEALLWFARAQERLDDERTGIVNLADVLRAQIAERVRERGGTAVETQLPDEALVRGDERLLDRVTANLLDNAMKYGNGRAVEVTAEKDGESLRLKVTNPGPAPSAGAAERLFEPFYRGARAASDVPGFGLGLPFARAVARAHGGDIQVAPDDPDLTVFVLTLPLVHWSEPMARSDGI
jgi:signal transduction histidine kinase